MSLGVTARIGAGGLGVLVVVQLTRMLGLSWAAVLAALSRVTVTQWAVLVAVWASGTLVHTLLSTAALPGISVRRALILSLCGNAMANVLPFGGAAGTGLGYAIARGWGVPADRYATFAVVSHIWSFAGRFLAGALILAAAAASGTRLPGGTTPHLLAGAAAMTLAVAATLLVLLTRSQAVVRIRRAMAGVIASGWRRMSLGVLGFIGLRWLLFWLCLHTVGARASFWAVASAFALERLAGLVPFAPAALGVSELSAIAVLVWLGVPSVGATAGAVLYRSVLVALEVPAGALIAACWWRRRARSSPRSAGSLDTFQRCIETVPMS